MPFILFFIFPSDSDNLTILLTGLAQAHRQAMQRFRTSKIERSPEICILVMFQKCTWSPAKVPGPTSSDFKEFFQLSVSISHPKFQNGEDCTDAI